ncbi:MAG: hypothetical protein KatS3mg119_1917 [Rhodothalassiaceae bacterium]|nr:MAG: hypothetical protein KatS3mg119_1917 [Rhodothalassiaceae bacterium]
MSGRRRRRILEELYRRHHDRLVGGLTRRLKSRADAEEVAQEAYLRCLAHAPAGDGEVRSWVSYLFRVARNLAIDRRRRDGCAREKLEQIAEQKTHAGPPRRPGVHGPVALTVVEPAGERRLDALSELMALAAAINALDPRVRQAFIWHRFHGLSYGEIARRLGLSVSSVEKYIMTALLACREARRRARVTAATVEGGQALAELLASRVAIAAPVAQDPDLRQGRARSSMKGETASGRPRTKDRRR